MWRLLPATAGRPAAVGCRAGAAAAGRASPSWRVEPGEPSFEARAAQSILDHGFAVVPGLFSPAETWRLKEALVGRTDEVLSTLSSRGAKIGVGSAAGFHEVCLRSPGRWDVPCDKAAFPPELLDRIAGITGRVLAEAAPGGTASPPLAHDKAQDPHQHQAVSAVPSHKLEVVGIVRAEPSCPQQFWHADSAHTSAEHGPPNLINVLVALRDVSAADGATEVVPSTHRLTNYLREGVQFGEGILYQNPENSPELVGSVEQPVAAEMPAGSALLFDDRVLHRGGGNPSPLRRDVAFASFSRGSYQPPAYYEASRSLRGYDHRALASNVRCEFPGLAAPRGGDGDGASGPGAGVLPQIFADGASGSQLHQSVIDRMVEQMKCGTANIGGAYETSRRAEGAVTGARKAMADFLNCASDEIVVGASMSALTFHVARALRSADRLEPGSNVVLDPISHGANVWPWVQLAKARGAEVRWLPVVSAPADAASSECLLDVSPDALAAVIDTNTRLVAMGAASNGVGSVHDVGALCTAADDLSGGRALRYVDAVHYAPHCALDVSALGCDMLACSPYKFFGPHSGMLFGRRELLASLPADRLDCQDDGLPSEDNCMMSRWEVGTQNYEALAGVAAAVDYLAAVGTRFGGADADASRRLKLGAAWQVIEAHENELKVRFLQGAAELPGLSLVGVTDPDRAHARTPTFAVAKAGYSAAELAVALCARGVWCTAGNHYAGFWERETGGRILVDEGMTRIGFLHYNTLEEVDRVLAVLSSL